MYKFLIVIAIWVHFFQTSSSTTKFSFLRTFPRISNLYVCSNSICNITSKKGVADLLTCYVTGKKNVTIAKKEKELTCHSQMYRKDKVLAHN